MSKLHHYRDLLDKTIYDMEQIRECEAKIDRLRLAVEDARRRVANRRAEIERLRKETSVA